jgi:hypothetical protein
MSQLSAPVTAYVGRTVDYLAFDDAKATGEALLTQAIVLPGQSGALITGIQKLVQRVLLELLTEQGSLEYDTGRGTTFITQIRSGMIRTSQDLFQAFNLAEVTLRTNLRLEEDVATDPADERYQSATLVSASLTGDQAYLKIQILSAAGTDRTVVYPLRITAI